MKFKFLLLLFINSYLTTKAQVKLQNGTPEFNLPMFNLSDKVNRVSVSQALNYIGGNGIKVNQLATEVGLGWELTSPGVIVRVQKGEPDDQKKINSLTYVPWKDYYDQGLWSNPPPVTEVNSLEDLQKYIYGDGYIFNSVNPEVPISSSAAYTPAYEIQQGYGIHEVGFKPPLELLHDREQDVFKFEFNGRDGSFVISKTGEIKTLEDSKLKVTVVLLDMSTSSIRTQIKSFTITDEFGIQYIFNDNSLLELCAYKRTGSVAYDVNGNYIPNQNGPGPTLPHIDTYNATPIGQYVINKWFLSDIKNPMTNKLIHLDYESYTVDCIVSKDVTTSAIPNGSLNKRISITNVRSKSIEKRIKKITMPDESFVQYDYNPIPRVDLMNSASLKKISINQGGHQISQEFEYGYFVKKDIKNENDQLSDLEKKYARLCLKSIEQKGENSSSGGKYAFNYFTGVGSTYPNDNIPPRLSIPTDIYGYYNYHYINEYDPSELDPNYIYPNYNILLNFLDFSSSIGGRQRNQYNPLYKNGLIQKITNPYKGTIEFEYEPNLKFDDSQASNNPYYGGARVAKTIQFDGLNHSNDIINEFKYIKPDGSCSIWGNDQANANYFNILTRQYKSPVSIKAGKMAKEFAIGLAIAIALKTNSGNQSVSSYGETAGDYYASYVWGVMINIIVSELGYMFSPDYTTIGFTNGTYFPNSFKNPLPQQFSRVEIIKRSATLNSGKTIYEFTSDQDYPIETPVYSFPFSNDYRSFNQAYGLTKKVTILNSANNKVKEIENSYDYKKNIITQTNFASQGWATLTNYTARYLDGILNINTIPNDAVTRKIYYPVTGRVELIRTVEKLYNNNGTPIASTTDYYYNSTNYQLAKTETTDSKGGVIKKLKYFPTDYNLSNLPIMQGLVNNNIINVPVSDEVWISKQIGTSEMISCSTTEFGITLNGDYKPIKEYGLQTDRPVALSVIGNFDPNQLIRNSSLIVPQSETVYNSVGNPSVLKDMKGLRNTATLYSYANRYPVASVTNATTSEVAYTSFEAFEQGFVHDNNWDISNVDVGTGVTPTGNKYCLLKASPVSSLITTNISINQEYKLSFWATSATFSVNSGALPTVTGPTIDGWTYYEFKIPPSSSGPNITGNNCKIDELRLYPKKSSMITSAYEIGIGIISECDINNRITYYEYDGLRRVSKVLDERHNIIKTYEYHFKN